MEKIICVDDNQFDLQLLKTILMKNGYDVSCMQSGQELLKYLENNSADLVLLDYLMAGLDGWNTFVQLQEQFDSPPPVIMTTGMESLQLGVEFLKAGGVDYIVKPIHTPTLLHKIHMVLENIRLNNELTKRLSYEKAILETERIKKEFISNISYELRNPLGAIIGYSEVGVTRLEQEGEQYQRDVYIKLLLKIQQNANRLDSMITGLLSYNTLEGSQPVINLRGIDLNNIFAETKVHFQSQHRQIFDLQNDIEQEIKVISDYNLLSQVLFNIIELFLGLGEPNTIHLKAQSSGNSNAALIYINKELDDYSFEQFEIGRKNIGVRALPQQHECEGLSNTKRLLALLNSELKIQSDGQNMAIISFELPLWRCDENSDHSN